MTRDMVVVGAMLVTFAAAVTVHLLVVAALFARRQPGRAALSFFVPPLAAPFAWKAGMRVLATVWLACVVSYIVAFVLAHD